MASYSHALFLLAACSVVSVFGCLDGYEPWFAGNCFRLFTTPAQYDAASSLCHKSGGILASIHSSDEQENILTLANSLDVWIGLRCSGTHYYWMDGSPTDYGKQGRCFDDDHFMLRTDGQWLTKYTTDSYSTLCKHTQRNNPVCEDYEEISGSGTCVSLRNTPSTWNDAEGICVKEHAHLVSIHNKTTNEFIAQKAVAAGVKDGLHIGLQSNASEKSLRWSDGTDLNYDNYAKGFPIDLFGHCTAMETTADAGQWITNQCETSSLAYMCGRPSIDINTPLSPATCPENKYFLSSATLYSPSYPAASGSITCEYFLVAPADKNATVVFDDFQSNKCCDKLEVYDSPLGGNLLSTLSGQVAAGTSYEFASGSILRLVYAAKDGVNVRGWKARFIIG